MCVGSQLMNNQDKNMMVPLPTGSANAGGSATGTNAGAFEDSSASANQLLQSLLSNSLLAPTPLQDASDGARDQGLFVSNNSISRHPGNGGSFQPQASNFIAPSSATSCALSRWIASQAPFANTVMQALPQVQQQQQLPQQDAEPIPLTSSPWKINANATVNNMVNVQEMAQLSSMQPSVQSFADFSASTPAAAASASTSDQDASSTAESAKVARFRRDQAEQWSERYDELILFLKEHGHCRVPRNHKKYGALSSWVKRQRYQYKLRKEGKPSFLTDERVAVLNRLGFVWDSHGSVWETRFQELQQFHREFGHSNVPYNYKNAQLSSWTKAQRREMRAFKEGKTISPEMFQRFLKLEKFDFCWQLRSSGRKNQSKEALRSVALA